MKQLWCIAFLALTASVAAQQPPSRDDIIHALKPKSLPENAGGLGVRSLRGLEVLPAEGAKQPSIDLYVNFKFNSAELEPDAIQALDALGAALNSDELKGIKISVVGHTDAKGTDEYNLRLSQRRAAAVVAVLVKAYHVDQKAISSEGKGKRELKNPTQPEDGINRRVEIRNVSAKGL